MAGIIGLSLLLILIFMGSTILTVVITVVYPAYKSMQALETHDNDEDDKVWLTYWCVFGVFTLIDEFGYVFLSIIPFYYWIKLGFFVALMHPKINGASVIYHKFMKPLMEKHRHTIEKFIDEVKGSASSIAKEGAQKMAAELSNPKNISAGL